MHPAASVIVFTSLSGAGYGLLFWLGLLIAADATALATGRMLLLLAWGFVLVGIGLFASLAHLGRPERAWLAFSQWRSSWLSREGVVAVLSVLVILALAVALWRAGSLHLLRGLGIGLAVVALLTVYCTARIYSSLKPIPAWHNAWVLPNYLLLAAASGAAWLYWLASGADLPWLHRATATGLPVLLVLALMAKLAYWRHVDRHRAGVDAASALALPAGSRVTPFESPHTEANFLLKEMGFALARKHGRRLRRLAIVLLVAPIALVLLTAWLPLLRPLAGVLVVALVMLAVRVERWLFFAQARHVVMTYYDAQPG